jgi:DNA-directed RNA polymerase specialized sigma24 family protein
MIDNPKTFRKLRSMLLKAAYAKTKDRMAAEDLVQETILSVCTYEVNDEEHLFRVAQQVLRRVITAYWRKEYNSPATVTPHEDFYSMEDVYGISEEEKEEEEPDTAPVTLTSDIAEAFVRVATELSKQLGPKHAAVACGMREKTLDRILSPWGQYGTDQPQPAEPTPDEAITSPSPHAEHTASRQSHDHPSPAADPLPNTAYTPHSASYSTPIPPSPEPHLSWQSWLSTPTSDSAPPARYTAYAMLLSSLAQLSPPLYTTPPGTAAKTPPAPLNADYADTITPAHTTLVPVSTRPPPPSGSA